MPSYILRHIDPELWKDVKVKCAQERLSIRDVIETLLRAWVRETPDHG